MPRPDLKETTYSRPDYCDGCSYQGMRDVHCPTNVALSSLGRIKDVVQENYELDTVEDAHELVEQLPRLTRAAQQCGDLLTGNIIEEPFTVTVDLSLTNFTVHSPVQVIPRHVVAV